MDANQQIRKLIVTNKTEETIRLWWWQWDEDGDLNEANVNGG